MAAHIPSDPETDLLAEPVTNFDLRVFWVLEAFVQPACCVDVWLLVRHRQGASVQPRLVRRLHATSWRLGAAQHVKMCFMTVATDTGECSVSMSLLMQAKCKGVRKYSCLMVATTVHTLPWPQIEQATACRCYMGVVHAQALIAKCCLHLDSTGPFCRKFRLRGLFFIVNYTANI